MFLLSPSKVLPELGINEGEVCVTIEGEEQALEQSVVCIGTATQSGQPLPGVCDLLLTKFGSEGFGEEDRRSVFASKNLEDRREMENKS